MLDQPEPSPVGPQNVGFSVTTLAAQGPTGEWIKFQDLEPWEEEAQSEEFVRMIQSLMDIVAQHYHHHNISWHRARREGIDDEEAEGKRSGLIEKI